MFAWLQCSGQDHLVDEVLPLINVSVDNDVDSVQAWFLAQLLVSTLSMVSREPSSCNEHCPLPDSRFYIISNNTTRTSTPVNISQTLLQQRTTYFFILNPNFPMTYLCFYKVQGSIAERNGINPHLQEQTFSIKRDVADKFYCKIWSQFNEEKFGIYILFYYSMRLQNMSSLNWKWSIKF